MTCSLTLFLIKFITNKLNNILFRHGVSVYVNKSKVMINKFKSIISREKSLDGMERSIGRCHVNY